MSEKVDKRFPGAHMEWALDLEDGRWNQGPGVCGVEGGYRRPHPVPIIELIPFYPSFAPELELQKLHIDTGHPKIYIGQTLFRMVLDRYPQ
jgi:hypothetical protein